MAVRGYPFLPYCGSPPSPHGIWSHWNLDPVLWMALLSVAVGYFTYNQRHRQGPVVAIERQAAFYYGWGLAALALTSPLCALSVSLFAARASQHMALTILAAPLIAFGLPKAVMPRWPIWSGFCFAVIFWFWHAPGPYVATFTSDLAYWAMHITTFGAAILFWGAVIKAARARAALAISAVLFCSLQMAFLGAILTFAPVPLYAPHLWTAAQWGLTPLADQQLGGVIMWAPAGLVFVVAIITPLALALRQPASLSSLARAQ